ncbi:VWA domain-containing protein [Candidatus Woesearchaeota archaeon]|nr:VWA domain-containing protein [Candidatus Pacearchaeota archaeon]MBI4452138.1 VWA domain-containing protein [Candidatus Woesearchaeota archaeon]
MPNGRAIWKSKKAVITGSEPVEIKESSKAEELHGKLAFQQLEDKFMHSVLENDRKIIDSGKLISDAINQGMSSFTPDLMFEQLVKSYTLAKQIYGESIIRLVSGYEPDYVKKNIGIPEFQRELKEKIQEKINQLKDEGFLSKDDSLSEKGIELASLVLYFEELDKIVPKGALGEKISKKSFTYGEKESSRIYKKGDRYRDIALKKSVKLSIRRGHRNFSTKDLQVYEKQSKGQTYIIYALDASGSMKGKKIESCKKAGIALAYKAINERNKVGLIVFGSEVKEIVEPTADFTRLLKEITRIRASKETDIVSTLKKSVELFPDDDITKHLILLTDALPTKGDLPEESTLEEVSAARSKGITISLIGINLDEKGKKLAEKITKIGEGRLYTVRSLEDVDQIVLEDYYSLN